MRVAYLSPLPPARTGIAHYSSMLLPALRERVEIVERGSEDVAIYQLGNNPHHEWIYAEAMKRPGVIVLHDVVLHHLIVEMTLARGDADGYVEALRASHGEAGAAWARGRAAGLHSEMGNFLFPASIDLAKRSRAVIVHNRWAADLLASFGVAAHVVPHPVASSPLSPPRGESVAGGRVRGIGVFGFLTSAKRSEVILEAAARAGVELLVVGEAAPNIHLKTTGYVSDEEFERYYGQVDRMVNLRYPSAGETSGTLLRAFQHGIPIAVSDYAQFAEYPDSCVFKVPVGEGEVEALVDFFTREFDDDAIAEAQRAWLDANARMELTVDGYLCALSSATAESVSQHSRAIPLFPSLEVVSMAGGRLTIRNVGDFTLRARVYGQPAYRLIAKVFDGDVEVDSRWLELPRDVAPGEIAELNAQLNAPHPAVGHLLPAGRGEGPRDRSPEESARGSRQLRLYHAIEGIPMLEPEAWYAAAL